MAITCSSSLYTKHSNNVLFFLYCQIVYCGHVINIFACLFSVHKAKKTLVSGNASDEKNLQPGGHKFIFFNHLRYSLFFLVSFTFFVFLFFSMFVCFLKSKVYILIRIRLCERVSDKIKFHLANFRKQGYSFLA